MDGSTFRRYLKMLLYNQSKVRQLEDNLLKKELENDKDRYADMDDAELTKEEQEHYVNEQEFLDLDELGLYGEEFNENLLLN